MATLLLKTEPSEYSFADLRREKRCAWTGVSNPGARIALRAARPGDEALIYHTGDERAIVGLARVARGAYGDPARPDIMPDGRPLWPVIDLMPLRAAASPLGLPAIKADARFKDFALVRQGRLSAMPVPPDLDSLIRTLAGL
ncbi:MAG: EVE domain-containing protein [Leptolyngbya sp. PLA1]|nr:EVE domain-containing protein [Leptolyngbya sp. PLA1]